MIMRIVRLSVIGVVVALLSTTGCLHRVIGAGSESGDEVGLRVAAGMSYSNVVATLDARGTIQIRSDSPRPQNSDWSKVIELKEEREALLKVERDNRAEIGRYLIIDRHWGMFGWDTFYLYFTREDILVYSLQAHID
jgi:hypothetical protein